MPEHRSIQLEDGSWTLIEAASGQAMHSRLGTWAEARTVYIEPSRIAESTKPTVLWDVGMGLGANALAAIQASQCPLQILSFEIDPDGLRTALRQLTRFQPLRAFESTLRRLLQHGEAEYGQGRVRWRLLQGDFFTHLDQHLPQPDLVFWDFYAPQAAPLLWGKAGFERLRKHVKPEALFLTYSAATAVRTALLLSGFHVGRGRGTSAKAETTEASLSLARLKQPLGEEFLRKLAASSAPFPYDWSAPKDRSALIDQVRATIFPKKNSSS